MGNTATKRLHNEITKKIERNDIDALKIYFEVNRGYINRKNTDGKTALYLAVEKNRSKIVEYLLSIPQIDPNITCGADNQTPLILASKNGYLEIVSSLANHKKTNLTQKDANEFDALSKAAFMGHFDIVKKLTDSLKKTASLQKKSLKKASDWADKEEHHPICDYLKKQLEEHPASESPPIFSLFKSITVPFFAKKEEEKEFSHKNSI